jgi:hypothetical protein
MPNHPALHSQVFLRRTFLAYHPKHRHYDVIATVGETLRYLVHLPAKLDGLHWTCASVGLCWAHRDDAGIDHATLALDNALRTDGLHIMSVPAAA